MIAAVLQLRNYKWYESNLPELLKEYKGKYLIIYEESMRGAYDTYHDALRAAAEFARRGEFLIEWCAPDLDNGIWG